MRKKYPFLTKEFLEEEYIKNEKSAIQIQKENNISSENTVNQYLKKYGLSRDPIRNKTLSLTKEYLEQKYIVEKQSAREIAKGIGLKGKATILKLLRKFDIPIRTEYELTPERTKKLHSYRKGVGDITASFWHGVKHGAEKRGRKIEFNITIEYAWELFLKQDRKCALSGIELKFHETGELRNCTTASLDRIDSSVGYIEGNVQWVHKNINTMKHDFKQEDFIEYCRKITEFNKNDNDNISKV